MGTGIGRHIPGAEAHFVVFVERPKAEALGYPDAKGNGKNNRRSFDFTSREVRERFRSG